MNSDGMQEIDADDEGWEALGRTIKERRLGRSLTLVNLAAEVGLSQPFLSQIENGRARPSLVSLHRIARALDTTPQAFFGGAVASSIRPVVVRAATARSVDVAGSVEESSCRVLLGGGAPFHVLEFDGLPGGFLDYFEHEGFEAVYVLAGRVELDLAGAVTLIGAGDHVSYPARIPHRLRSVGKRKARVLLIETKVEAVQDRRPTGHEPAATGRKRRKAATVRGARQPARR